MAEDIRLLFIEYLRCFTVKDFIQHTHSGANMYMCKRVVIYACLCEYLCVCIWVLVWSYWYAHIGVCVSECVFAIFICYFNPSSVFLYIIYITHCAITLLYTLMLYICDRSTSDLKKDDELKKKNNVAVMNCLSNIARTSGTKNCNDES